MIFKKETKETFKKAAENNGVNLPIKKGAIFATKENLKVFFSYFGSRVHFICEKCGV